MTWPSNGQRKISQCIEELSWNFTRLHLLLLQPSKETLPFWKGFNQLQTHWSCPVFLVSPFQVKREQFLDSSHSFIIIIIYIYIFIFIFQKCWFTYYFMDVHLLQYPLVISHNELERSTIFHGKTRYFYGQAAEECGCARSTRPSWPRRPASRPCDQWWTVGQRKPGGILVSQWTSGTLEKLRIRFMMIDGF